MSLPEKIKELEQKYLEEVPDNKKPLYNSTDFANGAYYLLHDSENIKMFINQLIDLIIDQYEPLKTSFINFKNKNSHISYYQRFASECESSDVRRVFYRTHCINIEEGKEWGQPYFALNATEREKKLAIPLNEKEFNAKKEKLAIEDSLINSKLTKENYFKI